MPQARLIKESETDDNEYEFDVVISADPLPPPETSIEVNGQMYVIESWIYVPTHEEEHEGEKVITYEILIYLQ